LTSVYDVQGVRVDPDTRKVWVGGEPVAFSRKEFDLLHALISRAGQLVSREVLMQEVWDTTFWTSSKTIDVHLGWVRRKLGDDSRRPHLISTVRGKGLRFELEPPVRDPRGDGRATTSRARPATGRASAAPSSPVTGTGMERTAASPWLQGQASDRIR
jgi:DNA-binding winged helix-turn-helix (wHTH) protein